MLNFTSLAVRAWPLSKVSPVRSVHSTCTGEVYLQSWAASGRRPTLPSSIVISRWNSASVTDVDMESVTATGSSAVTRSVVPR